MSHDPNFETYEAQAELIEIKQELERVRRERDELKNLMTVNNLMNISQTFLNLFHTEFILVNL